MSRFNFSSGTSISNYLITNIVVVVVVETTENSMYSHGEGSGIAAAAAALRSNHIHDNTNSFDDSMIVIYNRVPKTGSTSFINLAYDLCKRNHFYVLHINITANMHVLSLNNQVSRTTNVRLMASTIIIAIVTYRTQK